VLVGHSYGGFVITDAATGNSNVKALVNIDAFIPDLNQRLIDLTAGSGSCLDPNSAFSAVPFNGGVDLYLRTEPSGPPAWIPSWSLTGTADNAVPPALQEAMSSHAGAHISTIKAGHLSLITRPDAVTTTILTAINATT
jgi:pimeloyl-ACP methyl ester carboxylesterase